MPSEPHRIPQLDGLRGLAIAAVFLHHLLLIPLLWGGVDLFFVLSGFLITGILVNQRERTFKQYLGRFYARRARRLLAPYVIALALTALVLGTWWLRWWPYYLGAMNLIPALRIPHPSTLPLWSLAVEEQFYLVWPVAVFFLSRKTLLRLAIAIVVAAPVLRIVCTPLFKGHWAIYTMLPFRMDTLAAGAVMALLWPAMEQWLTPERRTRWMGILFAAVLVAFGALVWLRVHGYSTSGNTRVANFGVYESILVIAVSAFLLAMLGFCRSLLSSWPLVWLGRISYSLYLCHISFIELSEPGHHWVLAVLGSLLYALLLWFLVEAPLLRHGRRPAPVLVAA